MARSKTSSTASPTPEIEDRDHFLSAFLMRGTIGVLATLVMLALLSHHPDDSHLLEGGLRDHTSVANWIGVLGATVSGWLIRWFGVVSYFAAAFIIFCVGARLSSRKVRDGNLLYLFGVSAVILGASMFVGIFPGKFEGLAGALNILETPGGAFGQRFCAPYDKVGNGGWLLYFVNPTGSAIISLTFLTFGAVIVYRFDWYPRLARSEEEEAAANEAKAKAKSDKQQEEEDKKARLERRRQEREEAAAKRAAEKKKTEQIQVVKVEKPEPQAAPEQESGGVKAAPAKRKRRSSRPYKLPNLNLLDKIEVKSDFSPEERQEKQEILQDTLESFGIDASVGDITSGPRVTLFEIKVAPGVKVEKISGLSNNFAMALKAESRLRILTPLPGRDSVGIEVPNTTALPVPIRGMFTSKAWKNTKAAIPIALGKDIAGKPVILDLARAPHLLIAGATGSGKSVCMNTLILSLLYRFTPDELRLIMVDPKVVEFTIYNPLPHLVAPVINDVKKVPIALNWAIAQMTWRYKVLAKVGARNLEAFNKRKIDPDAEPVLDHEGEPIPDRLPFLVVIIDELADIMMTSKQDVETNLARIAQLARAVGIHAVIATQRPDVKVITGTIKANFPTRIAFQVSSVVDSRTIIDGKGAEALLGRGDMLFRPPGSGRLDRVQGAMVGDDETERVVSFVANQAPQEFNEDIFASASEKVGDAGGESMLLASGVPQAGSGFTGVDLGQLEPGSDEALLQEAIQIILRDKRPTISHLQRRLRIGYNKAAVLIEALEERGVIGPQPISGQRSILIDDNGNQKE
jgi:S-DNA-T family DNA segregation ATPase FtsK/SpoIIIE